MKFKLNKIRPTIVHVILASTDFMEPMEWSVLSKNEISGLLNVSNKKKNTFEYVWDFSSVTLEMRSIISKEDFYKILYGFVQTLLQIAESETLKEEHIVLDEDFIFYNRKRKEIKMIYVPIEGYVSSKTPKQFIEHFINTCKINPEENNFFVTRFINYLEQLNPFDLKAIQTFILEEASEIVDPTYVATKEEKNDKPKKSRKQKTNGQIYIFSDEDKSDAEPPVNTSEMYPMEIEDSGEKSFYLVDVNRKKEILLLEEKTMIGRQKDMDIVLDSKRVSLKHACIEIDKQSCFVVDLSSSNGTKINGKKLKPYKRERVHNGDVIEFASMSFTVKCVKKNRIDDTIVIKTELPKQFFITCEETKERICIQSSCFKIGKNKQKNHFVLVNKFISQEHVEFKIENNVCFIKDLNSSNGTKINAKKIEPETFIQLFDGDNLEFAKEKFSFSEQ